MAISRYLKPLQGVPAPGRIVIFLLILGLAWSPFALPILVWVGDANLRSLLSMPILYLLFLLLLQIWNRAVHQEFQPLKRYGLRSFQGNGRSLLAGLLIAWAFVLILFFFQGDMGWMRWFAAQPEEAFALLTTPFSRP